MLDNLKVGDRLVCTQNYYISDGSFGGMMVGAGVGKVYNVVYVYLNNVISVDGVSSVSSVSSGIFKIVNEAGYEDIFNMRRYRENFIKLSELRKQKLEKLGCTSLIITEE